MLVIQPPTTVWRFEINELKRQKGYLGTRFHSEFHWTKLLQASGKAEHFDRGMQKKKKKMKLLIALWLRSKKKRESLGSKTHILPLGMPLMTYFIQLHPAS